MPGAEIFSTTPTEPACTAGDRPSPWIERWAPLIAPRGNVLDVAAGSGRHARLLASRGHAVTAVDRDAAALACIHRTPGTGAAAATGNGSGSASGGSIETLIADIEANPWPLPGRQFAAIVVTNYLWRPLWPHLLDALAPAGVLLVETFAAGNESVGRPRRPEFLLASGELLRLAGGLHVVAYEDGFLDAPARFVQRLAAVRAVPALLPARYPLASVAVPAGSVESIDSTPPP